MHPRVERRHMSEDATLGLPAGWEETRFDRGAFGDDDLEGFRAGLERDGASIEVLPVSYRRAAGRERVTAVTEDWEADRTDPSVPNRDVAPRTAFATRLTYTPLDTAREEVVCVGAQAGDALAVGVWLAGAADGADGLRRQVDRHAGSGSPTGAARSDDEVLGEVFAAEPGRCVFGGDAADGHVISLPFRYVPLLSGARRTGAGVPRFPSTVATLEGHVSTDAWDARDLADVQFDAAVERTGPGEYRLDEGVAAAVAGTDVSAYALRRFDATKEIRGPS